MSLKHRDFAKAVDELKRKLQAERDGRRERVHQLLVVALRTDSIWEAS